ncbi:cobalamin biosynthesis protein [Pseudomonas huanghezhanensis]|uniref:cobalamin biosynthesis protein n=1 Tax=Pseudomonas huanghezhanensis TaxID=3002903 RepID=UPI002285C816|nr:cobalamin biosynthesis protein [Pseudomonas sp. BSw22131]
MSQPVLSTVRVIGIGCKRGCPVEVLAGLIDESLALFGMAVGDVTALASIDLKSSEPGLLALSERLGVPLVFFSADQVAEFEQRLSHRSQAAFDATGCYGVAESTALALAARLCAAPVHLLIARRNKDDATFALAGSYT